MYSAMSTLNRATLGHWISWIWFEYSDVARSMYIPQRTVLITDCKGRYELNGIENDLKSNVDDSTPQGQKWRMRDWRPIPGAFVRRTGEKKMSNRIKRCAPRTVCMDSCLDLKGNSSITFTIYRIFSRNRHSDPWHSAHFNEIIAASLFTVFAQLSQSTRIGLWAVGKVVHDL